MPPQAQDMGPTYTFDLAKIPRFVVIGVSLLVTVLIGCFNQTDIYTRLNSLPDDRTEFMPIKETSATIVNGSVLVARVTVAAITELTFDNIFRNLWLNISDPSGISFWVSAPDADTKKRDKTSFEFTSLLPISGNLSVQFCLFSTPFRHPIQVQSVVSLLYPDTSFVNCAVPTVCHFSNVCYENGVFVTFFRQRVTFLPHFCRLEIRNRKGSAPSDRVHESALLVAVPGGPSTFGTMLRILDPIARMKSHRNYVASSEKVWFSDIFNITAADESKFVCFDDVIVSNDGDRGKSLLRALVGKSTGGEKTIIVLDSIIKNVEALARVVCPECQTRRMVETEMSKVAQIFQKASYVIGGNGNALFATLAMANGTIIAVVQSWSCADDLRQLQRITGLKTILYEANPESRHCTLRNVVVNVSQFRRIVDVGVSPRKSGVEFEECDEGILVARENAILAICREDLVTLP
jgi:hypothetical protein